MLPITSKTQYRILYADTDMMGVVYYGNYGRLYEIGRTEMIRGMGMPYIELEKSGIVMPIFSVEAKYRKVIRYDELITIETTVKEVPAVRMEFFTRIFNEDGGLAHEAKVVLVFMDMKTGRPVRAPEMLTKLLENYSG
ncbi:MAG: acyl-CoA thioesterase [Bacteroidetes bacterium]|nr:MAG: acyl-CoA thioesterase [Bacteroidota bacterium]RLD91054.1 MAG: acyl-CoA thioesterase [Bacteroidota bacterium]RLD98335.1 MAG: acyl-CoA thioesterase [Bacteroidota bacterium]